MVSEENGSGPLGGGGGGIGGGGAGHVIRAVNGMISAEFHSRFLDSCCTLSVSRTGRLALLSGRTNLVLIDLDQPGHVLCDMPRQSRHEVKESQFHFDNDNLFALAVDKKAKLMEFRAEGGGIVETSDFCCHTRKITDLTWHEQETNLLATSSLDRFIHVWDIRTPKFPVISYVSGIGSDQVCWERTGGQTLATSHEGDIRLWDIRFNNQPKAYIHAHSSRILSMDYSPTRKGYLVSSSNDCKVKFWNTEGRTLKDQIIKPEKELQSPQNPVWRVRFTPFGNGLVTLMLSSILREENSVMLWNAFDLTSAPIHTFFGHREMVLEFCWRNADPASRRNEYQLVTWGKDRALKIWPIGQQLVSMCERAPKAEEIEDDDDIHLDSSLSRTPSPSTVGDNHSNAQDIAKKSIGSESGIQMLTSQGSTETDLDAQREGIEPIEELEEDPNPAMANSHSMSQPVGIVGKEDNHLHLGNASSRTVTLHTGRSLSPQPKSHNENLASSVPYSIAPIAEKVTRRPHSRTQSESHETVTLNKEFQKIKSSDFVLLESACERERKCVLSSSVHKTVFKMEIMFPAEYPKPGVIPVFQVLEDTTLDQERCEAIVQKLKKLSEPIVARGNSCMDSCVKQLEFLLQTTGEQERREDEILSGDKIFPLNVLGRRHDDNVPYPRSCGASFCGIGKLVVFFENNENVNILGKQGQIGKTPKALSACSGWGEMNAKSSSTSSQYYGMSPSFMNRMSRRRKNRISIGSSISDDPKASQESEPSRIQVYDCLKLQPLSRTLAKLYFMKADEDLVSRAFEENARLAYDEGKDFVVETFRLLSINTMLNGSEEFTFTSWNKHPLGRTLIESRLQMHLKCHDIQTVAVAVCLLHHTLPSEPPKAAQSDPRHSGGASAPNLHTGEIHFVDTGRDIAMEAEAFSTERPLQRAHSVPVSDRGSRHANRYGRMDVVIDQILSPSLKPTYENVKRIYAEILREMGLINQSIMVLKKTEATERERKRSKISVHVQCSNCFIFTQEIRCKRCQAIRKDRTCSICNVSVKGTFSGCVFCGHGGHMEHLSSWFRYKRVCPSLGCSCRCMTSFSN